MIYFDNAATTKLNYYALRELTILSRECFGNPSASYSVGVSAKRIINKARELISNLVKCKPEDLFFTSGGTEANNIIIQSFIRRYSSKLHLICSSIEHKSVLNVIKNFDKVIDVSYVHPNSNGIIEPNKVEELITSETKLICVQYINNELGTIQPIKEIVEIAKRKNVLVHVDAVQAVGHLDLNILELGVDSLSSSAHKFGGPKGIGFLFSKDHSVGLCFGGGQESNVKSGTENVPSISSMAVALDRSLNNLETKKNHITNMVTLLKRKLLKNNLISLNVINNDYTSILNIRIKGVPNEALVNYLDLKGICVSTGSACSGNSFERSYVLKEIGLTDEEIDTSIRISLSYTNTIKECLIFAKALNEAILKLRHN